MVIIHFGYLIGPEGRSTHNDAICVLFDASPKPIRLEIRVIAFKHFAKVRNAIIPYPLIDHKAENFSNCFIVPSLKITHLTIPSQSHFWSSSQLCILIIQPSQVPQIILLPPENQPLQVEAKVWVHQSYSYNL